MITIAEIGIKLKEQRIAAGLTRKQMAKLINSSEDRVKKIEIGELSYISDIMLCYMEFWGLEIRLIQRAMTNKKMALIEKVKGLK